MIGCRDAGPFDIWDTGVARNLGRIPRCGDVFSTTVEICETSRSRGEDVFLVSTMMNQITDTKEATSNRASNGRGYELRGGGEGCRKLSQPGWAIQLFFSHL